MIQVVRLSGRPGGFPVILEPVDHTDVLSIGFWQLTGSRDEEEAQAGYSHFLEHMLFKGTPSRTPSQIAQAVDRVGGYLNAFTEKEVTCFYCTLPGEHAELAVDVLADMYLNSSLGAGEIEKEKLVVHNEIKTIEDNPEEKGHQRFLEGLWGSHPLSRSITGRSAEIQRIGREGLAHFYRSRFVPENTVVTVSGRLDPQRLLKTLENRFRRPGEVAPFRATRISPDRRSGWELVGDKFEQVHLFAGISYRPLPGIQAYYDELVFNTLFGESMSSRLFQRVREEQGLCYAVYSYLSYFTDAAQWTIYASTAPELFARVLEAINEELGRLYSEPPGEGEVADAVSQLRGNLIMSKEDMESRMKRLFRQYLLTGQVLEYEQSVDHLRRVSRRDVVGVVERLVRPESFNLLAYGSRKAGRLRRHSFDFART